MISSLILGFILGVFALIGYGAFRALRSDGWDDSNFLNWLRLLSHVYIHPEDFAHMYYMDEDIASALKGMSVDIREKRPFAYIGGDEFAENFPYTRYVK